MFCGNFIFIDYELRQLSNFNMEILNIVSLVNDSDLKLLGLVIILIMGFCCSKEINNRQPVFSQLISVSTISKTTKLENIQKKYEFIQIIGYGVFGTVREAKKISGSTCSNTFKTFAIKSIVKTKIERKLELLRRELDILKAVDHPNIIRLFEVYEDKKYMHLVMEHCKGGDLLDHFLKKGQLQEQEVLSITHKALSAINYLHNLNICHRDIKPENFLLLTEDSEELKLVDFGMSNFVKNDNLCTFAGTPYYIAPEIIQGSYGKECDVWSLGVLMYFLLSGKQPFHAGSVNEVFRNILNANFNFYASEWQDVSGLTKDMISKMLTVHPLSRITIPEALKSQVFTQYSGHGINLQVFRSLKKFKAPSKLWQEAMTVFVKNFTIEQIGLLNKAFDDIDQHKTGWVTADDILEAMKRNNCTLAHDEFAKLVKNIEYIGKGKLNYSQFLVAAMDRKKEINEEQLWMLFKYFDIDDNGEISLEEMKYVFEKSGFNMSDTEIDEIIEEFKSKAPNSMNFDSFAGFMRCITEDLASENVSVKGVARTGRKNLTTLVRQKTREGIFESNSLF